MTSTNQGLPVLPAVLWNGVGENENCWLSVLKFFLAAENQCGVLFTQKQYNGTACRKLKKNSENIVFAAQFM